MAVLKYQDKDGNVKELDEVTVNYVANEWQPEPDWWDIDKILKEDEEDYPQKSIWLINDLEDTFNIEARMMNADKIKMSDGSEYYYSTSVRIHTWDKSKDKECSLGYKTRYVIFYWQADKIMTTSYASFMYKTLSIIFKNVTMGFDTNYFFARTGYQLESVKFKNCVWTDATKTLQIPNYLRNIELDITGQSFWYNTIIETFKNPILSTKKIQEIYNKMANSNVTTYNRAFSYNYKIEKINLKDTGNVSDWQYTFEGTNSLHTIENLNLLSATNIKGILNLAYGLQHLTILNLKISGFDCSHCPYLTKESILNILNALYDYSEGDTHTITLGATNLAKLTPEELAIGQNKNWTIS